MNQSAEGFIAVHLGAGHHSDTLIEKYRKLSEEACKKGIESLKLFNNVLEAVTNAVIVLENSPLTNAGFGSNLTYDGNVECDASIMDGSTLQYGAVGAITCIKNPVEVAKRLCQHQLADIGHGRVPPSFLVGPGALSWAKEIGIESVSPESLISSKSEKIHRHYKRKVETGNNEIIQQVKKRMDTVGAVCVDEFGNIAAACSSGGIILKYSGRVGQAAMWGAGTWASKGNISVATSTSGCGEHLIKTTLARTIAESITETECPTTSLHNAMQLHFIESRFLQGIVEKQGGVIAIRYSSEDDCGDLLWSHTTKSMIIGYMNSNNKSAKSHVSSLSQTEVGKKAIVEGIIFKFKKTKRKK